MTAREVQGDAESVQVRDAARSALDRPGRATKRDLMELAWEHVLDGVRRARRQAGFSPDEHGPDSVSGEDLSRSTDEVREDLATFLEHKLLAPAFLETLANAPNPAALLKTAALRHAIDQARAGTPSYMQPGHQPNSDDSQERDYPHTSDGDTSQANDGHTYEQTISAEVEASTEEHDDAATRRRAIRRACLALKAEERLLLSLAHVESEPLDATQVQALAEKRGDSVEVVQTDLAARRAVQADKRQTYRQELEKRNSKIMRLVNRIAHWEGRLRMLDQEPAPPTTLTPERKNELRRPNAFHSATPEERSGYIEHLRTMLEQEMRRRDEAQTRLGREYPAGPNYEEVAIIFGQVARDASDKARKTAADSIRVKLSRIKRAVRQAASDGGPYAE